MAAKHSVVDATVKPTAARSGGAKGETRTSRHTGAAIRLDKNGVVESWSSAAGRLTGLSAAAMVGRKLDAICIDGNLARKLNSICSDPVELALALDCGVRGAVGVRTVVSAGRDSTGTLTGYHLDILASAAPEHASLGLANAIAPECAALRQLDTQDSPAFLVDGRTLHILESNPAASLALGRSASEMTGQVLSDVLEAGRNRTQREDPGEPGVGLSCLRLADRGGALRSYGLSLVPVRWAHLDLALCVLHELTGWVSRAVDLAALNDELSRLARHDHLTGLFNRPMFQDTLELANSRVDRSGSLMGVLYIDLDGFKPVNDRFGHDVGDTLLVEVVRRLKSGLRSSDVMARLGGDEFGAILENLKKRDDALKVALNLIKCLKKPFEVEGECVQVSASIGAVVTARTVEDASALVAQADRTMYEVKSLERGRAALAPVVAAAGRS